MEKRLEPLNTSCEKVLLMTKSPFRVTIFVWELVPCSLSRPSLAPMSDVPMPQTTATRRLSLNSTGVMAVPSRIVPLSQRVSLTEIRFSVPLSSLSRPDIFEIAGTAPSVE